MGPTVMVDKPPRRRTLNLNLNCEELRPSILNQRSKANYGEQSHSKSYTFSDGSLQEHCSGGAGPSPDGHDDEDDDVQKMDLPRLNLSYAMSVGQHASEAEMEELYPQCQGIQHVQLCSH